MSGSVRRWAAEALEAVLVVGLVATALLGVVRPVLGPGALGIGSGSVFGTYPQVPATLDAEAVRVELTPGLPSLSDGGEVAAGDALEMTFPTGVSVGVYDPDLAQTLSLIGSEVLVGLVTVAVLALLLLIVRSLRHGDPFVPANARRLYAIAAAVGVGGQAALLLRSWGEHAVLQHPLVAPYVLQEATLSWLPLLAGLGVAVAAEVFRQGTALRRDVEGLV